MDVLNQIDPGLAIILVCGLCCGGAVLLVLLQVLTGALEIFFGGFEIVFNFLEGGPVAWCGCLFVLGGCGICGALMLGVTSVLSTCGTPDAVNFCRLF